MPLFSNILPLSALDLTERRVFLRADLDVPLSSFGGVLDDAPLRHALPTIRALLKARAKVVIGAHYGNASQAPARSATRCIARRLGELLGQRVHTLDTNFAGEISLLEPASVALTPNLAMYPEELANDADFAQRLARSLDAYVGDGTQAAGYSWASVDALPRAMANRGCGLRLGQDLELLELLADKSLPKPYVAIVGGDSFTRKSKLLWALLLRADAVLLGGAVANTCLAARGFQVGASHYELKALESARAFLSAAETSGIAVHLPLDVVLERPGAESLETRPIGAVGRDEAIVDIGLETCAAYREQLSLASAVLWNGSMGTARTAETSTGTYLVAQAATLSAQHTCVFGGRTVALADQLDVIAPFRIVSHGADGVLTLFGGKVLPGIESLRSVL
jgi:phosphoglycerate kinase